MRIFKVFLFVLSTAAVYFTFSDYRSMIAQYLIVSDVQKDNPDLTLKEVNQLLPKFPNVSITTMPLDAYRAYYYYKAGFKEKSLDYLDIGSKANPYIYFSEYLKAKILLIENDLDSAQYYAHKAFFGWPKTFLHYKIYNDILIRKNDTMSILRAFDYSEKLVRNNDIYKKDFIRALAEIKINSLVSYNDVKLMPKDSLYGKWNEVREFDKGEKIQILQRNAILFDGDQLTTKEGTYKYKIIRDTLYFYHLNDKNNKPLSKSLLYYSDKFNSMLFYPSLKNGTKKIYKRAQ